MGRNFRITAVLLLLLLIACPAAAQVTVNIDGQPLDSDAPSVIEGGRTLVPLRAIFEALGADIEWNESNKTVTATKGNAVVSLTIGNKTAHVNGAAVPLDVPGKILSGRTMVPLRFINDSLGAKTVWVAEGNRVEVTSNREMPAPEPVQLPTGDWISFRDLTEEYGMGISLISIDGDKLTLQIGDILLEFTRDQASQIFVGTYNDILLRVAYRDGQLKMERSGPEEAGWLVDSRWRQEQASEPTQVPAGDWIAVKELVQMYNLDISLSGSGDDLVMQIYDLSVLFTRDQTSKVFEASHQGVPLRIIREDGRFKIDLAGMKMVGWLDGYTPDGDWITGSELSRLLSELQEKDVSVSISGSGDSMFLEVSGFPAIEFARNKESRVFEAIYQGTMQRIMKHDGRFKVDLDGLRSLGWLD